MKTDYQNSNLQLCIVLNKFAKWYQIVKSKSISWLVFFLYNLNQNADLIIYVKNGFMIYVQVKCYKIELRDVKWKLSNTINEMKENLDLQVISYQKKSKTNKKKHNLNKNILKNKPN